MNGINRQPLYVKGDIALIAKYNKFDDCVEIADINNPSDGWTDYDPTQGASSDESVSYTHLTLPTKQMV